MSTTNRTPLPMLRPLPPTDRIKQEMVIGLFPGSETESTDEIDLLSRKSLFQGIRLVAPSIDGAQVSNPDITKRISDELRQRIGGWFAQDITPYIRLYDGLVSHEGREIYRQGGMTINWDETETAFYSMDFQADSWQVQAVGELEVFHCISLSHFLTRDEALQKGGFPSVRPLGSIEPLLAQAMPNLPLKQLVDHSAKHASNVFDVYLKGEGITVKAGVRQSLVGGEPEISDEMAYHYGIRINLDLRVLQQEGKMGTS